MKREELIRHNECFSFCQQSEYCSDEFIHESDHCFPVRKTFSSLFIIVGSEIRIIGFDAGGHEINIPPEAGISMLGDMPLSVSVAGFIKSRICTAICYEILVAFILMNVAYFSNEVRSSDLADTGNGFKNIHLNPVMLIHICKKSICHSLLSGFKSNQCFSGISNERAIGFDADRDSSPVDQSFNRNAVSTTYVACGQGSMKFLFTDFKNSFRRWICGNEIEHAVGKYIQRKDFRESDCKISFKLGFGLGQLFGELFSSSGNGSDFFSQSVFRLIKFAGIIVGKISNKPCVNFIGLGLSEGVGFRKVFDQYRINNKGILVMIQEKFQKSEVIPSSGFHKVGRFFKPTGLHQKIMEAGLSHWELISFFKFGFIVHDVERRFVFGNINRDYVGHSETSMVNKKIVPYPISRLTQALRLNQPIGIQGTVGRLLLKLLSLNKMRPSAPKFNTICV